MRESEVCAGFRIRLPGSTSRSTLDGDEISPAALHDFFLFVSSVLCIPSLRADRHASEAMRQSDVELNRVYQKALAAMPDADAKAKLRESQRAWVAFRDAEMARLQISGVGTGNTEKESHMTDVNNHRSKELQDLIEMTK